LYRANFGQATSSTFGHYKRAETLDNRFTFVAGLYSSSLSLGYQFLFSISKLIDGRGANSPVRKKYKKITENEIIFLHIYKFHLEDGFFIGVFNPV
jgi:hypothetical protein